MKVKLIYFLISSIIHFMFEFRLVLGYGYTVEILIVKVAPSLSRPEFVPHMCNFVGVVNFPTYCDITSVMSSLSTS